MHSLTGSSTDLAIEYFPAKNYAYLYFTVLFELFEQIKIPVVTRKVVNLIYRKLISLKIKY